MNIICNIFKFVFWLLLSLIKCLHFFISLLPLILNPCPVTVVVCSTSMSIKTMSVFNSLTMADSSLLSLPSLFYSKTKYPFLPNPSNHIKLQLPCSNSSPSLSLRIRRTHHFPLLTFVAQTSDWAQQEEEEDADDETAWENQGDPAWGNQDDDETEEGEGVEDGVFEERVFEEPSEDAKLFVGNLPFDVDSDKLAMLFDKAGTVEIAEVSPYPLDFHN